MGEASHETNKEHSSPIEFPCDFIVKIMGKQSDSFESAVYELVLAHFPETPAAQFSSRPSKDKNYLAITVTVYAKTQGPLDALYKQLSASPDVIMAL